ncbi:hypothetical protein [Erwinia sp. V71]|uniref:hypothetical protein n=1 Tax=Erwinia sp. V71 TaxID=3369424 RepID=UPI003F60B7D0
MNKHFSLLLLSLVAGKASAFQAKIAVDGTSQPQVATEVTAPFLGFHALDSQAIHPGTCSAVSVNGCGCPFCVQLRNSGR